MTVSPTVRKDCPCPKLTCKNHTLCDDCEAAQNLKGGLPFCKRPEMTPPGKTRKLPGPEK